MFQRLFLPEDEVLPKEVQASTVEGRLDAQ
jgi:hypothetical protein